MNAGRFEVVIEFGPIGERRAIPVEGVSSASQARAKVAEDLFGQDVSIVEVVDRGSDFS